PDSDEVTALEGEEGRLRVIGRREEGIVPYAGGGLGLAVLLGGGLGGGPGAAVADADIGGGLFAAPDTGVGDAGSGGNGVVGHCGDLVFGEEAAGVGGAGGEWDGGEQQGGGEGDQTDLGRGH